MAEPFGDIVDPHRPAGSDLPGNRDFERIGSLRAGDDGIAQGEQRHAGESRRKAVEKAQRNIRFEGIEKIERQGLTGAEMVVRVMNDTGYKLQLNMAEIDIYYSESRVGTIVLREPVEVPRRTTDSFRTLWRLKISDPMALYVLLRKVEAGDLSQVGVAYALEGRGGPAPVKISRDRMPLSDFLNTFGLTLQDVKNQLK